MNFPLLEPVEPRLQKRVIVWEWFTAVHDSSGNHLGATDRSLLNQAWTMIGAVALDYLNWGCLVTVPVSSELRTEAENRLPNPVRIAAPKPSENPRSFVTRLAADHDAIWLIAPETDRILEEWTCWAENSPLEVLSCPSHHVAIFSSKTATCDWLHAHEIPSPTGVRLTDAHDFHQALDDAFKRGVMRTESPVVVKPDDGVGGEGARLFANRKQAEKHLETCLAIAPDRTPVVKAWRAERYYPGLPASCGIAFDGQKATVLPATRQILEPREVGSYRRSQPLLDTTLQTRAQRLASRVADHLVRARGYYGVDMILGSESENDVVIEINPRMCASWFVAQRLRGSQTTTVARPHESRS